MFFVDLTRRGSKVDSHNAGTLSTAPAFTVILVDDLSRLSRDLVETLKLYRLKRHGI